ncbi:thioesterase II family protein [Vibrio caribbeanicus]|uniref:thioesterase II family protein n=1 Tax=Vibrio caribbeanicus TaxID=701175 RepID=UPI0030D77303
MKSIWFERFNPLLSPNIRIICFPYAGGNASTYSNWHRYLPSDIEVIAIQPPGRANRLIEPAIDNVDELIENLSMYIDFFTSTKYVLFGHSLGSRVAYALALRIKQYGGPPPLHFVASGSPAPHVIPHRKCISGLPKREFINELRLLNGTPEEVLQSEELMEILIPMLRADFKMSNTFVSEKTLLDCPISTICGLNDIGLQVEHQEAWEELTNNNFSIKYIQGNHFFIDKNVRGVVNLVREVLQ